MARYRVGLETRERILAAARELLAEVGLEGATLKAICDRARVGPGSFYNLFGSKEEVLLEVVRGAMNAVDPDPSGASDETVADFVRAYVDFVTGVPTLARIYLQIAVSGGLTDAGLGRRVLRHHHRRVQRVASAIAREEPDLGPVEARLRAEALLATLNGLALHWLLDPDTEFDIQVERLLGARASLRG